LNQRPYLTLLNGAAYRKKQFYFMSMLGVYSTVGDELGWTVSDLTGTDISWICVRLFLSVPPVTGERQAV
jgi:hypothetical protein